MKFTVVIQRNSTKERRTYTYEIQDAYIDSQRFSWEENNFSCDCNRAAEFMRAGGKQPNDEDWDSFLCSEGLYSVKVTDENGKVIYTEL